jgi:murein DD-endopeptidase MepM/ murein hydrolase activator NlpD
MTDSPQHDAPRPLHLLRKLPRLHLAVAAVAASAVFFGLLLPSESVQAKRQLVPLALELSEEPLRAPEATDEPASAAVASTAEEDNSLTWQELTVQKGDNLAKIFARAGLSANEMQQVLAASPDAKSLTRIFPGQTLAFQLDDSGQLLALRHEESRLSATQVMRDQGSFVVEKVVREPSIETRFVDGEIESSLYKAAADAGLTDATILELAQIFGGVIDFVLDLRKGDHFSVLFEEKYLDGERVGNGAILAASFTNQGRTYTAYRYEFANGDIGYFSEDGVSMRKAFLRAPLDFTRVSSGFNMKRFHPILKVNRPHRGIDYSAPVGTPVYASGDGRIAQSSFTAPNGNFIVIQHGQQYQTKYLHLQKRAVRVGERVRQGQLIGWVGSTGYSTGPHLHYEFLVNGVHRNPATIVDQLPRAATLDKKELQRFVATTRDLRQQFAAYTGQGTTRLASRTAEPDNKKL